MLARHDHIVDGDNTGNGRDDLYNFNYDDWSKIYLGMISSTGTDLSKTYTYDCVVQWTHRRAPHDSKHITDIKRD